MPQVTPDFASIGKAKAAYIEFELAHGKLIDVAQA